MKYLSGWRWGYLFGDKWLLWYGRAVLSGDALSTDGDSAACLTSAWPIYMFQTSNTGSRKYYLWKENDWLKNRPFFINENFQGILEILCAEPMRRNHDFLSLTRAVVGSTSSSCYFLLQCRCLSVCVLCVLVVRCVEN